MPVRPESSKIVMILFYLLLCTTYFFQRNFAKENTLAVAVEIKVARYEAQKKYRLRQIAWKFLLRVMKHRKNTGSDKECGNFGCALSSAGKIFASPNSVEGGGCLLDNPRYFVEAAFFSELDNAQLHAICRSRYFFCTL